MKILKRTTSITYRVNRGHFDYISFFVLLFQQSIVDAFFLFCCMILLHNVEILFHFILFFLFVHFHLCIYAREVERERERSGTLFIVIHSKWYKPYRMESILFVLLWLFTIIVKLHAIILIHVLFSVHDLTETVAHFPLVVLSLLF